MKYWLLIIPVALLVSYSQVIVKWRMLNKPPADNASGIETLIKFLLDPYIFTAYVAALVGSFAWLFVITKLPLTIAFPVYIGITFVMVLLGGLLFLSEALTPSKTIAISLILIGIIIGLKGQ